MIAELFSNTIVIFNIYLGIIAVSVMIGGILIKLTTYRQAFGIAFHFHLVLITLLILIKSHYNHSEKYVISIIILLYITVEIFTILTMNSIARYRQSFSQVENLLLLFYLFILLFWTMNFTELLFMNNDPNSLGFKIAERIAILSFFSLQLSGIMLFLIAKLIFFPSKDFVRIIEYGLYFVLGLSTGLLISNASTILVLHRLSLTNDMAVFILKIDSVGVFLGMLIVFFGIIELSIQSQKAYVKMKNAIRTKGVKIDPIALPRLLYAMYSMFFLILTMITYFLLYALNVTSKFGFTTLNFMYIAVIIFQLISSLFLFISFQTPKKMKKRWRESYTKSLLA